MIKFSKKWTAGIAAMAMITVGCICSFAAEIGKGQWVDNGASADPQKRYWFKFDQEGTDFAREGYKWIKSSDGSIYCYWFDSEGWLAVNRTLDDGNKVNENGRWVVDGKEKKGAESEKYYMEATVLANAAGSAATTQAAAGSTANQAVAGGSPQAGVFSGNYVTKGNKVVRTDADKKSEEYKPDPLDYELSSLSGGKASNNWANFQMNLGSFAGLTKSGDIENRVDFFIETDGPKLVNRYAKMTIFGPGKTNTDLVEFANRFAADFHNGVGGGKVVGTVNKGSIPFIEIQKAKDDPDNLGLIDHTYLRQVPGTNYVQIISITQNGSLENFEKLLATIKPLH